MTDHASGQGVYDRIGRRYASGRVADARWAEQIEAALGPGNAVVNVGAGAGSYEPQDRGVVAVEPSTTMIGQRPKGAAAVIRAAAEALPFSDAAFDGALAVLTVHHWTDLAAGIGELRRVSRWQTVLTFDPQMHAGFWLCDYIPEIAAFERRRTAPVEKIAELLGATEVRALDVPADLRDGVLIANWRRPEAYLDPQVRACCSGLAQVDQRAVLAGVDRLRADLEDGTWSQRYGGLLAQDNYDGGYRLILAGARD